MKPDLRIFLCMLLATMMLACQRQGTANANLDKDEEHDLVVAQELSNTRVQCIAEDASGQLWIGTFRGLNRYDGHEYHQYFCTAGIPSMTTLKMYLCRRVTATSGNC